MKNSKFVYRLFLLLFVSYSTWLLAQTEPNPAAAQQQATTAPAVPQRDQGEAKQLIPVDLKMVLGGKAEDVALKPNDILFVPTSTMKIVTTRTIEAAIAIGTGVAVLHR